MVSIVGLKGAITMEIGAITMETTSIEAVIAKMRDNTTWLTLALSRLEKNAGPVLQPRNVLPHIFKTERFSVQGFRVSGLNLKA